MNTRDRRAMLILIPGSLFLLWRLHAVYLSAGPAAADAASPDAASARAVEPAAVFERRPARDPRLARQAEVRRSDWQRDPFFAPVDAPAEQPVEAPPRDVQAPPPPNWLMTGASSAGGLHTAILGGQLVGVGVRLEGGYEVTEITPRSVTVRRDEWLFTFRLGQTRADVRREGGSE